MTKILQLESSNAYPDKNSIHCVCCSVIHERCSAGPTVLFSSYVKRSQKEQVWLQPISSVVYLVTHLHSHLGKRCLGAVPLTTVFTPAWLELCRHYVVIALK